MEDFKYEIPDRIPIPQLVSYKPLGRRAILPKKSWFGKLFDYIFGDEDIPRFIYRFEIIVNIPHYIRLGSIVSIDGMRWYTEQVNGPNRYTIVNINSVEETLYHFEADIPVLPLCVAVAEK